MPPLQVQGSSLRSLYKRSAGRVTFTMDPVRDLLIWAVVQNRRELAEIIWAQVPQPRALLTPEGLRGSQTSQPQGEQWNLLGFGIVGELS